MRVLALQKEKKRQERERERAQHPPLSKNEAVITLQRFFRGFLARLQVEKSRKEELEFLGMKKISDPNKLREDKEVKRSLKENYEKRKHAQRENCKEYTKATFSTTEKVRERHTNSIFCFLFV